MTTAYGEEMKQKLEIKHAEIRSVMKNWAQTHEDDLEFAIGFMEFMSSGHQYHPHLLQSLCAHWQCVVATGGMLRSCKRSDNGFEFVAEVKGRSVSWTSPPFIDFSDYPVNMDMLSLVLEFYVVLFQGWMEKFSSSLNLIYPVPMPWVDLIYLLKLNKFDRTSLVEPNNLFLGKSFFVSDGWFTKAVNFIIVCFGGEACEESGLKRIGCEVVDFKCLDKNPAYDGAYCDPAQLIRFVMSKEEITTGFLEMEGTHDNVTESYAQFFQNQAESRHGEIMSLTHSWLLDKYPQQEELSFAVQLLHLAALCSNCIDSDANVMIRWKRLRFDWSNELIKHNKLTLVDRNNGGVAFEADVCGVKLEWTIPRLETGIKTAFGINFDMVVSTMSFYQELLQYTLNEFIARHIGQDSKPSSLFEGYVFHLQVHYADYEIFRFLISLYGGEVGDFSHSEGVNFELIDESPVIQTPGVARAYSNSNWIVNCIQKNNTNDPPGEYAAGSLVAPNDDQGDNIDVGVADGDDSDAEGSGVDSD